MPNLTLTISASSVAWYGAIVASMALLINLAAFLHRLWQDSERITLKILPHMQFFPSLPPHPPEATFAVFKVINNGLRPITVTGAGWKHKNAGKSFAVIPGRGPIGELPHEIKPGENHGINVLQDQLVNAVDAIDYFYVSTATDKCIKLKMSNSLKKDFKHDPQN